jgi:hypothetical protein
MVSGGHPDNSLPGDQPGIDNSLPPYMDNTLPPSPPGVFPPPTISNPIVPIPPGTSVPPGTIWPSPPTIDNTLPRPPARPDNTLPGGQGGQVDNTLPGAQPGIDNTLPGGQGGVVTPPIANTTYWMLVYTPNHGWKYVAVDPTLRPSNELPPHAQPK